MVDWTHSFIRNASTLTHKYEAITGPYQTPNTTLLGFRIPPEQLTAWILDIPKKPLRVITDTVPEGKALLESLLPITKEPEYNYITWGEARELPDCLFVIPPHLDLTYHHNRATQFDELGIYLRRCASRNADFKPRDILDISRGWGSNLQTDVTDPCATSASEPSEKTHLFFFVWADAERERKWKDGTSTDALYISWDENFMRLQREWEGMGMRTESLHLSLEDFEEQLIWWKVEAEKAKRGVDVKE
ncbi:MAG: hypothetical protein Q9204_005781 [Flavoplaca sp. TL-2023a]